VLFILFGSMADIHPVLLLHLVLLPVNLGRLIQIGRRIGAYRLLHRQSERELTCPRLVSPDRQANRNVSSRRTIPRPDLNARSNVPSNASSNVSLALS
jgi:hypothetical protein